MSPVADAQGFYFIDPPLLVFYIHLLARMGLIYNTNLLPIDLY